MSYTSDETIYLQEGRLVVDLEVTWQVAEPDVGIMSDYVDDFRVTNINGSDRHIMWLDKLLGNRQEEVIDAIYDNQ